MYKRERQTDAHTDRHTDGHRMTAKAVLDAIIMRQKLLPTNSNIDALISYGMYWNTDMFGCYVTGDGSRFFWSRCCKRYCFKGYFWAVIAALCFFVVFPAGMIHCYTPISRAIYIYCLYFLLMITIWDFNYGIKVNCSEISQSQLFSVIFSTGHNIHIFLKKNPGIFLIFMLLQFFLTVCKFNTDK